MLKQILIFLVVFPLSLLALNTGDTLPKEIQQQLHMKTDTLYTIDFFASWCKSCKKELPLINNIYKTGSKNIIGINVDKNKLKAEKYVKNLQLLFPIIYDTNQSLINTFKPLGFPTLYYVKNGKILKSIVGTVNNIHELIKQDIQELQ